MMKVKKEKAARHRQSENHRVNNLQLFLAIFYRIYICENSMTFDFQEHDYPEGNWERVRGKDEEGDEAEIAAMMRHQPRPRGRKKHNNKSPEVMAMRRRKIWIMMSKKELGKVQRAKTNNHKEMLISCKKVAQHCMKYWRQKAMQVNYPSHY